MRKIKTYIRKLVIQNCDKLGIKVYPSVGWFRSIDVYGKCDIHNEYIKFSEQFIESNKNNKRVIECLVAHEVCHLLVKNHNRDFKKLCKLFGDDVPYTSKFTKEHIYPSAKYKAICEKCGIEYDSHFKPKDGDYVCEKCGAYLAFELNKNYKCK